MDWSALGSLGMGGSTAPGVGGGVLAQIMKQMNPAGSGNPQGGAPSVPADGSMQPTIGPGAASPSVPAPAYQPKLGLPKGGLLAMANGTAQPQGLAGLLQHFLQAPSSPGAGTPLAPPQAGMMPGQQPQSPAPASPGLPTDINPMNQF